MRALRRAFAVTCASALAVPLWAVPAHAETAQETASSVAYFSATGIRGPDVSPQPLPNLISDSDVDGVAAGNLGVAADGGQESKVSFVYFSMTSVPFDATISKAVLRLKLAPDEPANRRLNAAPENVRVCAPDDTGFAGQDGQPLAAREDPTGNGLGYGGAPARQCDLFQAGAQADGETYVFDVTALAQTWSTANDGIAITKSAESAPAFQVVFTPDATLDVEYVPTASETTSDLGTFTVDDVPTFTETPAFDAGSFSGTTDVPAFDTGSLEAPLVGGELPAAAEPETAPAVAARAALDRPLEALSPTPAFWVAALLLAGGLVFLSLVLGDSRAVVAAAARPSRLSRALSSGVPSVLSTSRS